MSNPGLPAGRWQDFTTAELAHLDAERCVALLPVAAVEQHGPHLPVGTDALINAALVDALLAQQRPGLIALPAMPVGHSLEHGDFPGTLSIGAEALLSAWESIGASLVRSGARKLVILNTHGGNIPLVQLAALRLRASHSLLVVRGNYFAFGAPEGLFPVDELRDGLHGGEMETSLMLHLYPHLVRREQFARFDALPAQLARRNRWLGAEKPVGIGWLSQDLHPEGVCGNAARADAVRGRKLFEHLVEALLGLLDEVVATSLETLRQRPTA
ncbi:MAG: creatininase family protein [Steroidobacteraceae bacterium]